MVLVVGDTGSGKSTLVNYLMGSKFQSSGSDEIFLREGEKLYAEMGTNSARSETSYPQIFSPTKVN